MIHSCLLDLIDVTLAVEDVSTKNVDIVAVADGGGEETIDDRLVTVDSSATASQKPKGLFTMDN